MVTFVLFHELSRKGKTIATESKLMVTATEGGGDEECLLMVKGASFWGDENVMC